jgi:hypothetical protein
VRALAEVFAVLSAVAGFVAAGLWFKASTMPLPLPPHGTTITAVEIEAEYLALVRTAIFNRWAAIATAAAALFGALSVVVSSLS